MIDLYSKVEASSRSAQRFEAILSPDYYMNYYMTNAAAGPAMVAEEAAEANLSFDTPGDGERIDASGSSPDVKHLQSSA